MTRVVCENCSFRKINKCKFSLLKERVNVKYNFKRKMMKIKPQYYEFPNPQCPLIGIDYTQLLEIAKRNGYKAGWAYFVAKELNLNIDEGEKYQ